MTEIDLDLLLNYPLIKKQRTTEGFSYTGVVEVNNVDYKVKLKHRKNKFIFHDLDKLNSIKNELNKEIGEKKNLSEVLDYFRDYVKGMGNNGGILINKSYLYRKVLLEYIEFTKFYLNLTKCQLSNDFMKILISMQDENKREHSIVISIDDSEVHNIFKLEKYDLPIKTIKNNSSLTVLFDQFLAIVEVLKPYFDFMEHLDNTAWILDPVEPKKCHNYRRIYLGENTSVTVRVDAYNIKLRPEILFLGPERIVETYRDNLNTNLDTWDENGDTYTQLLKILGMENFPKKLADDVESADVLINNTECSICFTFNLNEKNPDIICRNEHCESCYHSQCLYEWLITGNVRRVFSELHGLCPNCEKQIACPIP